MPRTGSTRAAAAALALLVPLALAACGGGDDSGAEPEDQSPEEVLADAQQQLTDTPGVQLSLTTDDLPDGINGIQKAVGTATAAPGFDGSLTVFLDGQAFDVPVIAVDGVVCAQIPLTPGWSDVDPEDYGAPDPAGFLSPDDGFASLLDTITDLEKGDSVRGGANNDEILTTFSGTVPGKDVARVIPGATGDFDLTAQVTEDDELREMALTGVFYKNADANTYTVGFDDYGVTKDLKAPCP